MPVQAQFNTIAKTPERYKVEALQEGMKKAGADTRKHGSCTGDFDKTCR